MPLPRTALLLTSTLALLFLAACGSDDDGIGDLRGTYALDRAALAGQIAGERGIPLAEARNLAASSEIRLDLLDDGAFVVRFRYGKEEGRRRGTWRHAGRNVTLRTTHTSTGPLTKPTELVGTYESDPSGRDALRFPASDAGPHPFVLRRR